MSNEMNDKSAHKKHIKFKDFYSSLDGKRQQNEKKRGGGFELPISPSRIQVAAVTQLQIWAAFHRKRQTAEERARAWRVELTAMENSRARSQGIRLGSNPEPGHSYWLDLRNAMGQ